jgi:hypothetical protein
MVAVCMRGRTCDHYVPSNVYDGMELTLCMCVSENIAKHSQARLTTSEQRPWRCGECTYLSDNHISTLWIVWSVLDRSFGRAAS